MSTDMHSIRYDVDGSYALNGHWTNEMNNERIMKKKTAMTNEFMRIDSMQPIEIK